MPGFSELVHFTGEQPALIARVKAAVEWIYSKPEGQAKLEEAFALHKKPLEIATTDSAIYAVGYGDTEGRHVVFANPAIISSVTLAGQNGEKIKGTIERFLAHEFTHAAQPGILASGQKYVDRHAALAAEAVGPLPVENYMHRFGVAKGDDDFKRIFAEVYDTHIAPRSDQITDSFIDKVSKDPVMQHFIHTYETPAIDFENLLMQKYKGEPNRSLDYAQSSDVRAMGGLWGRDNFVESALASVKAYLPEPQKAGNNGLG